MANKLHIAHAAVKAECGTIVLGKSHADCFRIGKDQNLTMSSRALNQGFYTSDGLFVDRVEAAKIAWSAGQTAVPHTILFSENIWGTENGSYDYDEVIGYYKKKADSPV